MSPPLVDRNTGDVIPAADHNDVKDYVEDGTYRVNTLSLNIGGTEIISSGRNIATAESGNTTIGTVSKTFVKGDQLLVTQTATSGYGVQISRDLAAASTNSAVVYILQDNATDDQAALSIKQDAPGYSLQISGTDTGAGTTAVKIEQGSTSNQILLGVYNWSGGSSRFYRNQAAADTAGPVVGMEQVNAGDDQVVLSIQQAATASGGLLITGTGDSTAWLATFTETSQGADTCRALFCIGQDGDRRVAYLGRNLGSADTGRAVVEIQNANAGDDQNACKITSTSDFPTLYVINSNVGNNGVAGQFEKNIDAGSVYGACLIAIQDHVSGVSPALYLIQDDTDKPFIRFEGQDQGTGHTTIAKSIMVNLYNTAYYLNLYS